MGIYFADFADGAAWITGASTGIGREMALRLANLGYRVYASARSAEKLTELSSQVTGAGQIIPLPLNVTDREANIQAVKRIVSESGRLILAIFNAGNFFPVGGDRLNFEAFDDSFAINLSGVVNGLLPAIDAMKQAGMGQIAIVASSAGFGGLPKSAAYGASKAAIINMAESLKFDLDRMNIRIQVVTPGFVDTPLTAKNDFPMPFLMPVEEAGEAFMRGLKRECFEITFPWQLTCILKLLNLLPYRLYFTLLAWRTGAGRKRRDA